MAIPGKTTGAEYLFRGSPEECLDSAMAYLQNKGYQIETRIENQVSMSRPIFTRRWGVLPTHNEPLYLWCCLVGHTCDVLHSEESDHDCYAGRGLALQGVYHLVE